MDGHYLALGSSIGARTLAYRELFRTEMDEDFIHEMGEVFSQEKMLGGSRFLAQVERTIGAGSLEESLTPETPTQDIPLQSVKRTA